VKKLKKVKPKTAKKIKKKIKGPDGENSIKPFDQRGKIKNYQCEKGVATRNLQWEELVHVIHSKQPWLLGRLSNDYKIYRNQLQKITEEYSTVGDYLKCRFFQYDFQLDQNGKKWSISSTSHQTKKECFVENDFPYSLATGIEHYVLWVDGPLEEKDVEEWLNKNAKKDCDKIWYLNLNTLKSVKDVNHAHIFYRQSKK